jgi:hypothetical protein
MKRLVIAGALASLAAWSGASAQTDQAREGKGKTVTLTGCLAKGDMADSFTLTNARMGGATAGTTGEKPTAKETAPVTYHLSPGKTQKMEAHVGHTVEITGTMDTTADEKSAKSGASSGAASGTSAKAKGPMQHVTVTGLKHVSGSCS